MLDGTIAYRAMTSRDARFDGVFFVGVTSTGIYCRPICPVKTPRQENCRYFDTAEAAERADFRPCLRCRPELAPGNAPIDDAHRIAHLLAQRLQEGLPENGARLATIAAQFDLSSRQLRRIVHRELGVSPIELLQTRRLLLSKQLLTESRLRITDIAFASGFSSLRRFNDAFSKQYRMPPSRLRKHLGAHGQHTAGDTSRLQLVYRPPYDWQGILAFLKARMMKGVEWITEEAYWRTVRMGKHTGWIAVRHVEKKRALTVEFSHSLAPVLPSLLGRLRHLFDLSARPDLIAAHLIKDPLLENALINHPGLRVPGAFSGFELAVRAIVGQQVTVRAATTLACRFAEAFGEAIVTPLPELKRFSPLPSVIASASPEDICRLGIIAARARAIIAVAQACERQPLLLEAGVNPQNAIDRLKALPGIGPWTAHYIAMRALRWPDAFPTGDIAVLNNLGGVTAKQAEALSQVWRPWRSYAVMHIWTARSAHREVDAAAAGRERPAAALVPQPPI